jgi:hypothetical protein
MSNYTLYLEPNALNGLYTVDLVQTQVQLTKSQKEWLLKLIKSDSTTRWVLGTRGNTIIYEDNGQLKTVLGTNGGSRRRGVRKSSRKSSNKRSYKRSY